MLGKLRYLTPYFSKKIAPSGHLASTKTKIDPKYNWIYFFIAKSGEKKKNPFLKQIVSPNPTSTWPYLSL